MIPEKDKIYALAHNPEWFRGAGKYTGTEQEITLYSKNGLGIGVVTGYSFIADGIKGRLLFREQEIIAEVHPDSVPLFQFDDTGELYSPPSIQLEVGIGFVL